MFHLRKRWTKRRRQLVGRIIFAKILKLSPVKFKKYIETVERDPLFTELLKKGIVKMETLLGAKIEKNNNKNSKVIARITNRTRLPARLRHSGGPSVGQVETGIPAFSGSRSDFIGALVKGFSINYTREGFSRRYMIDNERLAEFPSAAPIFHKLRHITSRNELIHKVLKGLLKYQKNYFVSGNPQELKTLTQTDFVRKFNINYPYGELKFDSSCLSRIVKGKTIITSQNQEVPLKFFFHGKKEFKKKIIRNILNKEKTELKSGKIKHPYSDTEIKDKLKTLYGVSVSIRSVSSYRTELGILSFWKRQNYTYPLIEENFSSFYPFTFSALDSNVAENSGIYELRLAKGEIEYYNDKTGIFYIGSARDLRKRLKAHLSSKNGSIKKILKKHKCFVRYIVFQKDWKKEEKRLYKLFLSTYGAPPKCNKVSP